MDPQSVPPASAAPEITLAQRQAAPSAALRRDLYYQQSLGALLNAKIIKVRGVRKDVPSRVLMVGAGGIGCELLKNLVLAGFGHIEVIDLDTIDLSNLNRQFLFRREHIKKPKALVAKEAARKFNPNVEIVAYHANVKDEQFSTSWFRQFAVVFNALDNLDARRYVNRMCLAADVPLIESGTAGLKGQVQVIKKGVTACYDCSEKETAKSFPVCTIRSTPSQPIHCIVWGKSYLVSEIFGASEDESAFDNQLTDDNASEIEELKKEAAALRLIRQSVGTDDFAQMLFDKVFNSDIHRLRSMEDMWKSRRPPEPLQYADLHARAPLDQRAAILAAGQKVWTLEENFVVFLDSLDRLGKRMLELRRTQGDGPEPMILFDKDDADTLDFVAASANIRSIIFGIEPKSRFDVKEMAGNIIPAIATTNALVAGLCVLEAFKVLKGDYDEAKEITLIPFAKSNKLIGSSKSMRPNPKCKVCSMYQTAVAVDLSRATLHDLVEDFVRLELGFGDREFAVNSGEALLYDVEETDNLGRKLVDLGITAGSMITIVDQDDDDPYVTIVVNIEELISGDASTKPITSSGRPNPDVPRQPKRAAPAPEPAKEKPDGAMIIIDGDDDVVVAPGATRKRPRADEGEEIHVKRTRTEEDGPMGKQSGEAIIVLDD